MSIQEDREVTHSSERTVQDIRRTGQDDTQVRQSETECQQMTKQEKKQYEWYMKMYRNAENSRDPDGERERISMILAALFPHCSHMPPERTERKQGRKKGLQGETPGESRDDVKARTAAQKLEQQQQRTKARQRALEHAAPQNIHHMSTRQKAQTTGSSQKRSIISIIIIIKLV